MVDKITKLDRRSAVGTGLQGYLRTTYGNIVKKLGEPHLGSGDGKVRFEWVIKYGGVIFTIYDYKERLPKSQIREWHIGGQGSMAVKAVGEIFGETKLKERGY